MVRSVNVSGQDNKASQAGSGTYDPLPAGIYNVTIFDHQIKQYGSSTANSGRDFLALQLRISEGQKGTNRRLFVNVGDFPKWAPKNGKEAVNFLFFQFYKSLGVEFPDGTEIGQVDLPDYEDLNGSSLAVKVVIKKDDWKFKQAVKDWNEKGGKGDAPEAADFLKNEVSEFLVEQDADSLVTEATADEDDEFSL